MLERIKQLIEESASDRTSFQEHYVKYMLAIQDMNIESEVSSAFKRMSIEIDTMNKVDKLIENQHRKMVK